MKATIGRQATLVPGRATLPALAATFSSRPSRLSNAGPGTPLRSSVTVGPISIAPDESRFDRLVQEVAGRYEVDPALIKAVIRVESGFNPLAVSKAGAKGLMQLMDGTARGLGVKDPFDPEQNINGGTLYLRRLLDRYGDIRHALAAYNAGPAAVDRYGGVPPYRETQSFVPRVLAYLAHYRARGTGPDRNPEQVTAEGEELSTTA